MEIFFSKAGSIEKVVIMITHCVALGRKIEKSHIEEIYERLHMPTTDQNFVEVLAEFGIEIGNNPIFEIYIKSINDKENEYRQKPEIASILQKATYIPTGQQILDQKNLTRKERISEYFSLWLVLRFRELYDISLHDQIRDELIAKDDLRGLADFEEGVILVSNILEGNSNANLADFYLSHVQRVMRGIINFFDKQRLVYNQDTKVVEQASESGITSVTVDDKEELYNLNERENNISSDITAEGLFFNKDNGIVRWNELVLTEIDTNDYELILFTCLFFPNGCLSKNSLGWQAIFKNIMPKEKPLIAVKEDDSLSVGKVMGNYEYDHVRYLRNKLNKLVNPHIKNFIILKKRRYFPLPSLFKKVAS